jgi:hypothetical protein
MNRVVVWGRYMSHCRRRADGEAVRPSCDRFAIPISSTYGAFRSLSSQREMEEQ